MPIVYVDLLFLINAMIDSLLLNLTAMLRGYYVPPWRKVLSSTIGGLLGVMAYFLSFHLPDGLLAACTCGFLVLTAWGWKGKVAFLKDLRLLWGSSMVLSGAVCLLGQWCGAGISGGGAIYFDISPGVLLGGAGLTYGMISCICRPGRFSESTACREITCRVGSREVTFRAMVDTGNLLCDGKGRKVILLSWSLAAELMGDKTLPVEADALYLALSETCHPGLLPYRTAGGEGLLVTIQSDHLMVDGVARQEDYILGFSARELDCAWGCRGLIGC
ncbi:MAG: sigma-E processing peptidase SpoIIGA [Clostridia bacterium]|nr:sigma-E processing peptidase SpoIIGA [Clostridia bacterium]